MDYEMQQVFNSKGIGVIDDTEFIIDFISDNGNKETRDKILKALDQSEKGGYMLIVGRNVNSGKTFPMILAKFTAKDDSGLALFHAVDIVPLIEVLDKLNQEMGITYPVEAVIQEWLILKN